MAIHFSSHACKIPRTEESGGLQSIGLQSQILLKQLSSSSRTLPREYKKATHGGGWGENICKTMCLIKG